MLVTVLIQVWKSDRMTAPALAFLWMSDQTSEPVLIQQKEPYQLTAMAMFFLWMSDQMGV